MGGGGGVAGLIMASLTERGKGMPSTGGLTSWDRDRTGDGDCLGAAAPLGAVSFRHLSNLAGYAPGVALTTHLPPGPRRRRQPSSLKLRVASVSQLIMGRPNLSHTLLTDRGARRSASRLHGVRGGWGLRMRSRLSCRSLPPLLYLSLALFPWQPHSLVCPGSPGQLLQKRQGLLSRPWSCPGEGSLTSWGTPPPKEAKPIQDALPGGAQRLPHCGGVAVGRVQLPGAAQPWLQTLPRASPAQTPDTIL